MLQMIQRFKVIVAISLSTDTHGIHSTFQDCVSSHSSTSIIKFADDTVVLGLISNNDETAYLDEVERLTSWCQDNCLSLNVSKTKELIVDFRKRHLLPYTPLMISGTPVERVSSFIPRCKHLRGPDLDYTHSNTG